MAQAGFDALLFFELVVLGVDEAKINPIILKEEKFVGIITRIDLLAYLKRN